jgi:predicted ATPase/DNA-binding SARP family transcriptional activator
MVSEMEMRVLGPLEVVEGGRVSAPSGSKERAILARLLLEPDRPVSIDALLEAAWPDRSPEAAARSLHVRLTHLRNFLEPGRARGERPSRLVRDSAGYRLAVDPEDVDARRFERLVREASSLSPQAALAAYDEALRLWRGPPFAEVSYADFAQLEIRRLEEMRARADEGRARTLVDLGRHEEALPDLQRLVGEEPLREELVRALALGLYRAGRQVDALEAIRALGTELRGLGLDPGGETRELERQILVHDPALAAAPEAAAVSGIPTPAPPRRLPRRASRFFGRGAHLAHAAELIRDCALVTVTGVGGAGKTRLALELAERLRDRFGDARWWCELAPIDADADVPGAVADALGVESSARSAGLDRALEHLASRRGLLLLDNCEHVLDGAAAVVERLLVDCPDLRVVATSRSPLGVQGEQVVRLPGLELPARRDVPDAGDSPAVALFLDRARAAGALVDPAVQLAAVSDLCRQLDGLPLAIELAAGRTRSMTPVEIAERLDERFDLLAAAGRRTAPRHTTLRAAIDWSYELLDEPQTLMFERLSVFARGATLDGVGDVCAGEGVEPRAVLALLDQLVAHSMVTATPTGRTTLYGMLETLREYAAECLERRGEQTRLRHRHADHYAARAQRMTDSGWQSALPFIDELDDVRAAVRWCLDADPGPERAFTIMIPLWGAAPARYAGEIAVLAEEALGRWPQDHPLRIHVLGTASTARLFFGDPAAARRHAEAALALEERAGATAQMAWRTIAHLAMYSAERREALAITQGVAARLRAAGGELFACECDGFTVQLLHATGEGGAADALATEMRRNADRLGAPFMACWARYVSGIAQLDRDPREARRWLDEAVALGLEVGHHHMVRFSLRALGVAAFQEGEHDEAAARLLAALEHDEARSDAASQWTTLMALAPLIAERGRLELATELLAASEAWPAAPFLLSLAHRTRERIGARLSDEQRAEAVARGLTTDLAAAKAMARAELADLRQGKRRDRAQLLGG